LEHLELMAQGEDFRLQGGSCAERRTEGVKKRDDDGRHREAAYSYIAVTSIVYNAYGLFSRDTHSQRGYSVATTNNHTRVGTYQPNTVSIGKEESVRQESTGIEALNNIEGDSESVYEVRVGNIEREGRAAEHDERPLDGIGHSIGQRAQNRRRPERHQQEEQARRICGYVQEIDECAEGTILCLPGIGLAVDAGPPEHNTCCRRRHTPGK
jgi:hypothetical protein